MCIIQGNISKVSNTCIFVAPLETPTDPTTPSRQLTVYSNRIVQDSTLERRGNRWVTSRAKVFLARNAGKTPTPCMILPAISFSKGSDVVPVEFRSNAESFFDLLDNTFPKPERKVDELGGFSKGKMGRKLEVIRVGSYDVSIVPTIQDFSLLDEEHFVLDPNLAKLFAQRYETDSAFVVCRLRHGEKFHPIAYTSSVRKDGSLFVPTYHYHGHPSETKPDWDHVIYAMGNPLATFRMESSFAELHSDDSKIPLVTQLTKKSFDDIQDTLPVSLQKSDFLKRIRLWEVERNCDLLFSSSI